MRPLPSDVGPLKVEDLVFRGIVPLVTCGGCGRQRLIHGGLLQRRLTPTTTANNPAILAGLARNLRCSACGHRGGTLELGS